MLFQATKTVDPIYTGGAVSAVDNLLATSVDSKVLLSDLKTGQQLATFEGDGETLTAVQISPDKSLLVTASRSLQIHIYSLETNKRVNTIHKAHDAPIMAMTIDPTSTLIATGGAEGAVKVWDIQGGYASHNLKGHGGIVTVLKFYGKLGGTDWRLASGADDSKVRVWDLIKSKCIKVLDNHVNVVRALDWNATGDVLLTAGRDKVVSLYKNYELVGTLPVLDEVEAAGFASSRSIYTGVPSGVKLWSLQGEQLAEWAIPSEEAVVSEMVRPTSDSLLAVLSDQTLVELAIGEENTLSCLRYIAGNHGEIIDLVSGSQDRLAIATNSQEVRVLELSKPLDFMPLVGHKDIVIAIDVLGQWLVSGAKDKEARLWDMNTGECKIVFTGHAGSIGAVAISRQGSVPKFVLTGSQDLTVKKWSADGEAEYTRKAHDKDINCIDVSADDKLFATGSQDRTAKIWNVETGEVSGVLRGHRRGIWSIKFAKDQTVVTGSGDKTIRQWNLHDYTCLRTFEGHLNSVLKVAVYGDYIASAGGDGLVKVWDPKTSESIATLDNHEDKVWSLCSRKEELISGGGDGVLTVWQDYTEQEQARQDQEQEEQIERQQELDNCVRNKEWDRAIALALELNHPFRLLKLFTEVSNEQEPQSFSGLLAVDQVLARMEGKRLIKLLERVRDWNTNGRTSAVAQTVLHTILRTHTPEQLSDGAIMALISSIVPYTERHLARSEELLESSYALDYTLKEMALHL